jgi:hypothetical protein
MVAQKMIFYENAFSGKAAGVSHKLKKSPLLVAVLGTFTIGPDNMTDIASGVFEK